MEFQRLYRKTLPSLVLAFGIAVAPLPAAAESAGPVTNFAYGAGSAVASLVYGPAKVLYAIGGSIIAGCAYLFSGGDGAVASPIIDAAMRGDYVISPDMLRGERELHFIGERPEYQQMNNVASPPPASGSASGATREGF
jgi:hypothetical protein